MAMTTNSSIKVNARLPPLAMMLLHGSSNPKYYDILLRITGQVKAHRPPKLMEAIGRYVDSRDTNGGVFYIAPGRCLSI
jgi:hypothetical protein